MLSQVFIFVLLQIPLFYLAATRASNHLFRGSSVSINDAARSDLGFLISKDGAFTCGFYGSGANAYWFAIWFTNSKDKTVVWMANRDKPVNGQGSRLNLREDGALVLTDLDGSIAWQTNTTLTDVVEAKLRNSGNLVLEDVAGRVLWQSFDSPTDTLLPTQPFTKNMRLISGISPQVFASGYFSFFFDSDNVLKMIYDGPEISSIYWPNLDLNIFQNGRTTYNSSRIAILDEKGSFVSSDQMAFDASDMGIGVKRRLTMDHDGNLRLYSLNESSGSWAITWQAIAEQCVVHGLCGRNGICVYAPEPTCSCPPQHKPTNSSDWGKGCKPSFKRSCLDSGFVEMTHVDYYGFDLNYSTTASFEQCKHLCLGDCRCQAFSYRLTNPPMCLTKSSLFNGYRSSGFPGNMYLRVPKMAQALEPVRLNVSWLDCGNGDQKVLVKNATYVPSGQKFKWAYLYSFTSTIGAIEFIILAAGWFFLFRKHGFSNSLEDGYRAISSQFRSFSYGELKKATRNFTEVVGTGGFGAVYKGVLADERVVAIKKLGGVIQGEEEFWAEVNTIGRINHFNLARMWGFCSEGKKRLLVYEYIERGSLDKHLFGSSSTNINTEVLGWKERFKIALGTAKGLAYLHHECLEWVIHCDVKPENILLDVGFEPKISDFGLAKLCQRGGNGSSDSFEIRGTKGYMAPEWTTNLPVTSKVDVYSYGVVIMELVRGVRLSSHGEENEEEITELASFVRLAKSKMLNKEDPSWVEELVDPRLGGQVSRKEAAVMIEVGLSCVDDDRKKRPTMESVAQLLAECEDE